MCLVDLSLRLLSYIDLSLLESRGAYLAKARCEKLPCSALPHGPRALKSSHTASCRRWPCMTHMHITGVSSELQLRAASHLESLGLELAMHVLFAWWKAAHFDRLHPLYYVHDSLLACHRLATFLDRTVSVEIVELVSTQLLSQKARLMCVAKQRLVYVDSSRYWQEGASFAASSSCGVPLCGTLRKAPGYASGSLVQQGHQEALKTARRAPRNFISYVSRFALVDQLTQAGENLVSRTTTAAASGSGSFCCSCMENCSVCSCFCFPSAGL